MDSTSLEPLVRLIAHLRGPEGCPWDRRQTLGSVRAYLLEEAHETAAAIDRGDAEEISSELGDLLFQVAFTAALAAEAGGTGLGEVIERTRRKMVERHPHVFGDETLGSAREVQQAWEQRKARANSKGTSVLDGVPDSVPALLGAYRMTQKASGVGFDWPEISGVLAKVREEIDELEAELPGAGDSSSARITEEIGDLFFALANLSRHLEVDPEAALAQANDRFRRRFRHIERRLEAKDTTLAETTLAELDRLWEDAKAAERDGGDH